MRSVRRGVDEVAVGLVQLLKRSVSACVTVVTLWGCSEPPQYMPGAYADAADATRPSGIGDASANAADSIVADGVADVIDVTDGGASDASAKDGAWLDSSMSSNPIDAAATADTNGPAPSFAIERVSVAADGAQANGVSNFGAPLSSDGRYVAFVSSASNLVPGDTNGVPDVFRVDRLTDAVVRVSVATDGTQANAAWASNPTMTSDGRYVLFASSATNLAPGDTNGSEDMFLRDIAMGITTRVSTTSTGAQISGQSASGAIAGGGRYVVFTSNGNSVVQGMGATSEQWTYLKDLTTGQVSRVSSDVPNGYAHWISHDGSTVAFNVGDEAYYIFDVRATPAKQIVKLHGPGPQRRTAALSDDGSLFVFDAIKDPESGVAAPSRVFLFDRSSMSVKLLSATKSGEPPDGAATNVQISGDGRYVAFATAAANLGAKSGTVTPMLLDRLANVLTVLPGGNSGASPSGLSRDGTTLAVISASADLVPNDTNQVADVFVISGWNPR
jgi:Tol biopolymer transport system component